MSQGNEHIILVTHTLVTTYNVGRKHYLVIENGQNKHRTPKKQSIDAKMIEPFKSHRFRFVTGQRHPMTNACSASHDRDVARPLLHLLVRNKTASF